ncbi:hypothetical protein OCL06_15615 [Alteromonas sp. ASW11-19]|uniref:PEP-CTERM sorting domain-containing protein n=1 Tax=Alteromonas salexigens TaxID=2982530 RepID=A0ABT2VUB3_9ALTE|nr:hypothetical protein [Alteromonas salexigens]MCU7556018.1 hypothetical protein [Alteromonas salexigens]
MYKKILMAVLLLASTSGANAAVINFSFTPSDANLFNINLPTPTNTLSAATFTLNVAGDFNFSSEHLTYNVEGLFNGIVLDNNTGNDAFNFGNGDDPISSNAPSPIVTSFAIIPQITWLQIISDGIINLTFTTTRFVDCCSGPDVNHLSGSFQTRSILVSSPSIFAIFVLAFLGVIFRKVTKQKITH